MTQDQRTPFQRPKTWDARKDNYEHTTEALTGLFVEQILDAAVVGEGFRVLDVAAGTGAVSIAAVRRGATVEAIDFSSGMVDRLRERLAELRIDDRVNARVMDGQALAFPDASFDAVCSNFGTVFFPDPAAGLREMHRVLRPGGRAVITGWTQAGDWVNWIRHAWQTALPEVAVNLGGTRFSDPELMRGCYVEAGFAHPEVSTAHATRETTMEWVLANYSTMVMAIGRLPADQREKIDRAFANLLGERFGDANPTFRLEANLGVGVR